MSQTIKPFLVHEGGAAADGIAGHRSASNSGRSGDRTAVSPLAAVNETNKSSPRLTPADAVEIALKLAAANMASSKETARLVVMAIDKAGWHIVERRP